MNVIDRVNAMYWLLTVSALLTRARGDARYFQGLGVAALEAREDYVHLGDGGLAAGAVDLCKGQLEAELLTEGAADQTNTCSYEKRQAPLAQVFACQHRHLKSGKQFLSW